MLDYLIMYEHGVREINSACLLKAELEMRGYSVQIENTIERQYFRYHFWYKPKVILVMSLYNDHTFYGHVNAMVGYHRKVVNLQWEQIGDAKSRGKIFVPSGICKKAVHICWSEKRATILKENGCTNAIVCGPIQMDFLKEEFKPFYKTDITIRKEYGIFQSKIILYISSFTYVQMRKETEKNLTRLIGVDIKSRIIEAEEAQKETLLILEKYILEHKDEAVIYRPHPGEIIADKIKYLLTQYDNFYLISEYSIQQWIQISDIVITWISTAVSEVYFANKKCIILQPTDLKHWRGGLYEKARIARNYNELLFELNNELPFPVNTNVIIDNYGSRDAGFAYKKIVDLLEEIYKFDYYDMPEYEHGLYLKASFKRLIKVALNKLSIKETTFPFSKISKCREWLAFYADSKIRKKSNYVSDELISDITKKIKELISNSQ